MYINPTPEDFNNAKFPNKGILIAHAGGAIGGKTYTNSIEAINAFGIKKGRASFCRVLRTLFPVGTSQGTLHLALLCLLLTLSSC